MIGHAIRKEEAIRELSLIDTLISDWQLPRNCGRKKRLLFSALQFVVICYGSFRKPVQLLLYVLSLLHIRPSPALCINLAEPTLFSSLHQHHCSFRDGKFCWQMADGFHWPTGDKGFITSSSNSAQNFLPAPPNWDSAVLCDQLSAPLIKKCRTVGSSYPQVPHLWIQ